VVFYNKVIIKSWNFTRYQKENLSNKELLKKEFLSSVDGLKIY